MPCNEAFGFGDGGNQISHPSGSQRARAVQERFINQLLGSWHDQPLLGVSRATLGVSRQAIATKTSIHAACGAALKKFKREIDTYDTPERIARRTTDEHINALALRVNEQRAQPDR